MFLIKLNQTASHHSFNTIELIDINHGTEYHIHIQCYVHGSNMVGCLEIMVVRYIQYTLLLYIFVIVVQRNKQT